jgi:hypothetical protein
MKAKTRRKLPPKAFADRKAKKFPIGTPAQARASLRAAGRSDTAGSYRKVAKKVRAKHGEKVPSVGPKKGSVTKPGFRKARRKGRR